MENLARSMKEDPTRKKDRVAILLLASLRFFSSAALVFPNKLYRLSLIFLIPLTRSFVCTNVKEIFYPLSSSEFLRCRIYIICFGTANPRSSKIQFRINEARRKFLFFCFAFLRPSKIDRWHFLEDNDTRLIVQQADYVWPVFNWRIFLFRDRSRLRQS